MSVLNSEDRDGCDLAPIHSAAGPHRDGVVGQNQDQPLRPVEVQRELPLSVPLQLVKPPWSIAEVLQDRWRNDAVQPPADQLGSMLATGLPQELEIIAFLLEVRALKAHLQGATLDKIAGDREKGPGGLLPVYRVRSYPALEVCVYPKGMTPIRSANAHNPCEKVTP